MATPELATRAVTVLHSTEPATVYLSLWARVPGLTIADVDRALFDDAPWSAARDASHLVRLPARPAAGAWGSASARVADTERKRVAKDVVLAGMAADGDEWLDGARADVLEELAGEPTGLTALELRDRVPTIAVKIDWPGRCGVPAGCSPTSARPRTSSVASTRSTGGCRGRAGR